MPSEGRAALALATVVLVLLTRYRHRSGVAGRGRPPDPRVGLHHLHHDHQLADLGRPCRTAVPRGDPLPLVHGPQPAAAGHHGHLTGDRRRPGTTACPRANLDLDQLGLTGAFIVPAGATATVLAPRPISLLNLPVNQDACKNVHVHLHVHGHRLVLGRLEPAEPHPDPHEPPPAPESPAKVGTATQLSVGPNPVAVGQTVTITSRVARTTGAVTGTGTAGASAIPTGAVSFYLRAPSGAQTLLGTIPLDAQGVASLRLTSLPPGSGSLYAVYTGTDTFAGSTSPVVPQSIIAPPAECTGTYSTSIIGTPGSPVIKGTTGNDFIYAVGGNYKVSGGKGNDCLVVGDGNNVISDGTGADVVIAGNGRNTITVTGSRNTVVVGDGNGNRVTVKGAKKGKKFIKPSSNRITIGDGARNRVTLRRGTNNQITVGNGASNRVTVRKGPGTSSPLAMASQSREREGLQEQRHRRQRQQEPHHAAQGHQEPHHRRHGQVQPSHDTGGQQAHQHLLPAHAAALVARRAGGLLPRHHRPMQGGDPR